MLITGAICDKCGRQKIWEDNVNKGTVTRLLRKHGWTVGKQTVCTLCNEKAARERYLRQQTSDQSGGGSND